MAKCSTTMLIETLNELVACSLGYVVNLWINFQTIDLYNRFKSCSALLTESPVRRQVVGIDTLSHLDLLSFFALGADVINRRIFIVRRVEVLCHSRRPSLKVKSDITLKVKPC